MIIRPAAESDLLDILSLYSQPDMDDGKILPLDNANEIFTKMNTYPDYTVFVAVMDDKIIGTFALIIMDNLAHLGSKSGLIEDVVVATPYQNKGIGKRMMKYAIELCRAKSCYKVSLSSNMKRNIAHEFYKSLGFKIHGYSFLIEIE